MSIALYIKNKKWVEFLLNKVCYVFYFIIRNYVSMNKEKTFVVFDLETTGLEKDKDQIIQFSAVKFNLSGKIIDSINYQICPDGDYSISIQAYLKHGITPQMLADKPHLIQVADDIISFFGDSAIVTYNGTSFDIPFLVMALKRVGKVVDFLSRECYDVYAEERRRHGMHLDDVFKRYTGKTMEEAGYPAHDALGDSKATLDIFKLQMEEQEMEPEKMITEDNVIVNSMFQGKEQPCFNIGKYKDLPISYVATIDQGYLTWCVYKAGFVDTTKNYIRSYLK